MKKNFLLLLVALCVIFAIPSCDSDTSSDYVGMTGKIDNLPALSGGFEYAAWLKENNNTRLMGVLEVNSTGTAQMAFAPVPENIKDASSVFITVENGNSSYTTPSNRKILDATFGSAESADFKTTSIGDFSGSNGIYILDSPTTSGSSTDNSGIWFVKSDITQGLKLPVLSAGWKYEGWVTFNALDISTGKFTDPGKGDELNVYGGNEPPYDFPGEDFNKSAPAGATFPQNLKGKVTRISIEPEPDNDAKRFGLTILIDTIPNPSVTKTNLTLNNAFSTFPIGTISKEK